MANPDQPTPHDQLVAEYELPESDSAPEPEPDARPRGPDGKFVPAEPKAEAPKHSPFQVRLALDAGFSQAEIDGYTPDALEAVVRHEYRRAREDRERARTETPRAPEPNGVPAEFTGEKPKAEPTTFDAGLSDDNSTPELRAAVQKVYDHFEAKFAALEKDVTGVKVHVQGQAALTVQQKLDKFFAERADRYGTGGRADLANDSDDLHKRMAVIRLAESIRAKGEDEITALKRADKIIYGGAKPTPEPEADPEPTAREKAWADGTVARPTHQVPPEEPKGKRRAARAVAAILAEQRGSNGTSEHADLPD